MMNTDIQFSTFMELVKQRYSCRSYADKPVEREKIAAILDAARLAPSACNKQPWLFIVADEEPVRTGIIESYPREWARTAPAFIVVCGDHNESWHRPEDGKDHMDVDCSIAAEHICLAAAAAGLGTCWICNFDPAKLRETISVPEHIEPVVVLAIGYPFAQSVAPEKKRKHLDEIVRWGSY